MMRSQDLVRRLWQYCNVLRDDGLSYPDYVEQLTYLLFLKMADERHDDAALPSGLGWNSFSTLPSAEMHAAYTRILNGLGDQHGTLGLIFRGARNKISDPAKLRLLVVDLIGETYWSDLSGDLKGDAYEGLLEKNARDTKSGAGQYFTPRPLIEAIVECLAPEPGEVINDPACGTGGFLLRAHDYVVHHNDPLTKAQADHLRTKAIRGTEIVQEVARLAAMNLYLHGVMADDDADLPVECADSLRATPRSNSDIVVTNPPFGIRGSVVYGQSATGSQTEASRELTVERPDFTVRTANKQLNFLQHILSMLKPTGRAAVVVPDNVLFEGGAAAKLRRRLLEECDLHTVLRLPPGLFYAQGVLANVLFFDRTSGAASRRKVWVYDLRTGNRFSLKTHPLSAEDLTDFVLRYASDRSASSEGVLSPRWKAFEHDAILAQPECRLDLAWSAHEANGREPLGIERIDELAEEIVADLQRAIGHLQEVADDV